MLREYLRLAFKTLGNNRLRATLTVLSITIGVAAVILLTSLAQSGLATLVRGIEDMGGTRFIMVMAETPKKAAKKQGNYLKGLTYADARALEGRLPHVEHLTPLDTQPSSPVRRPGQSEKLTDLVGTSEAFVGAYRMTLEAGRDLTAADLATRARVCVVGDKLAEKLFPGQEAVGQELVLKGDRYRVVGRLAFNAKGGASMGFDWNDLAIAPITVTSPSGRLSFFSLTSTDPAHNQAIIDRANAVLMLRHHDVDDFQFLDFGGMLKGFYSVFYGMILVVGLIAGMSLVIGGVGIMNIMLVAVTERKREIGLRKAVGATGRSIMGQFLVEAILLSLSGAAAGALIGVGGAQLAALVGPLINKGWVGVVSQQAIVLSVLSSAGIGLFFGWYPAKQAAALDPILCLRSE
ncbi:ABC transporter permease [bacterium]|nr:ABC transporter permease [bacterium]